VWDNFIYYLTAGLCLGAVYSLIALGYTLVYGIIKLINFAHGEFCMVGAYAGLGAYVLLGHHLGLPAALALVLVVSGLAGAAIAALTERMAYRPIRTAGRLSSLLTAIGVSLLLQNLANFVRNGNPMSFPGALGDFAQHSTMVGAGGIKTIQFAYIVASIVLTGLLWYVVQATRFGRAMRAASQDLNAARLMGINTDAVIAWTFVIGGFFGGVAGALMGLIAVVEPMMGFMPGLNAFVAAVVGGIGSIPGAMLGGYLLGVIQYLVVWAGVPTGYKDVASFVVLILVLVLRPQGILGKKEAEKV
jgi:branched-chain amino acid transport system permease protein